MDEKFLLTITHDKDISIEAKGIYLYFYALIKNGQRENFPIARDIPKILGITGGRYYRHIKDLINGGYLEITLVMPERKNVYRIIKKI